LGHTQKNIRANLPILLAEVKKVPEGEEVLLRRWDGSCRWNPLGDLPTHEEILEGFHHLFPTHTSPRVLA